MSAYYKKSRCSCSYCCSYCCSYLCCCVIKGPRGFPGPQGPPGENSLTTYGDAGTIGGAIPVSNQDLPLTTMFVSSNTTLVANRIVIPTSGIYEVEYTTNVQLYERGSAIILEIAVNGGFIVNQSRTRAANYTFFSPESPSLIEMVMSRSVLLNLAAGDQLSIAVSSVEGSVQLLEPNLKVIKIDD
ncbi:hypothetical protein CHN50_00415 [Priestia aryabhattai]|uniref:hypothetical protein n=1 Tax=Bacillus sp. CBEL-1 TaxID=2502980 RepID=UPI000BA0C7F9|nr:hypothetical protein [Bacillus sp. CBEL-1]OZT14089.1 hypothetical protein CHN50_00415 [Priestia aryabhattai]TDB55102.1 hypothetical protein EPL02_02580 [Bacillus sp. CBEL-1]